MAVADARESEPQKTSYQQIDRIDKRAFEPEPKCPTQ
jgi:hypothetical protein